MKNFMGVYMFATAANAFVGRSDSCCFQLTASGGASGSLGQLNDGQVRLGDSSLSASEFCLSNSIITDSEGRGCVVTSETSQFQCDEYSTGTSGFSLTSSGLLEFDSSSSFIACQTGENNGRNIYTTNSTSVTNCISIELTSNSCYAAASSSRASPTASVSPVPGSSVPAGPSSAASSPPSSTRSYPLAPTGSVSHTSVAPSSSASKATSVSGRTGTTSSTTSTSSSGVASTAPAASSAVISIPALGFAHLIAPCILAFSLLVVY